MVYINPFGKELNNSFTSVAPKTPPATGVSTATLPNPWSASEATPSVRKNSGASGTWGEPVKPPTPTIPTPAYNQPSSNIIQSGSNIGLLTSPQNLSSNKQTTGLNITPPTQNATTQTVTPETTPSNNWEKILREKYGVTETTTPKIPEITDTVSQYGLSPAQIEANLAAEKEAIKAKYDIMRREAETKTESERQSQLSGLYSLGEVNPLASGTGSISTASADILNKRKDAITAAEAEETASAVNRAYGYKQSAQTATRQQQQDVESQIKTQYQLEQTNRENNINNIKNAMALVSAGKQLEQNDKDNAWTSITNLLSTYGSSAFEGADEKSLTQMETAAGLPKGTLTKGLKTLKEQELLGKSVQLEKGADGAIYSVKLDKDGNYTATKIIAGKSSSTGGGGGVVGTYGVGGGQYTSDLDAIIGSTMATISSKFGQQTFKEQISKTRNDADKINLVASVALKNQPAEIRRDFTNQSSAIQTIDKAINLLDEGVKTGVLQSGQQYLYNVFGKDYDPKLAKINSYIVSSVQPYRNSVTGAAWGDQEDAEYASLFGSTKYSPAELKQRLQTIKEIMKAKSVDALNVYVNPMGTYDNVFSQNAVTSNNDPLGIR